MRVYKAKITIDLLVVAGSEDEAQEMVREHVDDTGVVDQARLVEITAPLDVPPEWCEPTIWHRAKRGRIPKQVLMMTGGGAQ